MSSKLFRILFAVFCVILFSIGQVSKAQAPSWDKIPNEGAIRLYDLPSDICYSIVDQSPLFISLDHPTANDTDEYQLTYVSTSGDVVTIVYYWSRDDYYYFDHKLIGKNPIQPKCYQNSQK